MFFSTIFFIMMAIMESHYDFYQFRWLVVLAMNQLLILFSIDTNPLHSLVIVAIVMKPLLDMIQVQDLKKVDPYNTLLKSNKEKDDLLPSSGLASHSSRREMRQIVTSITVDSVFSVALLMYLIL